jgi:hypothetical protein
VFSFRSFAKKAAHSTLDELNKEKCAQGDLNVDEFLEQSEFARVTEEKEWRLDTTCDCGNRISDSVHP